MSLIFQFYKKVSLKISQSNKFSKSWVGVGYLGWKLFQPDPNKPKLQKKFTTQPNPTHQPTKNLPKALGQAGGLNARFYLLILNPFLDFFLYIMMGIEWIWPFFFWSVLSSYILIPTKKVPCCAPEACFCWHFVFLWAFLMYWYYWLSFFLSL